MNTPETTEPQNTFDPHALRVLEYDKVIVMLAERSASSLGVERAHELLPSPVQAFIRERQQETAEARLLTAQQGPLPLGGIHDVRPSLVRAEVGQSLTPHDLSDLVSTLITGSRLKGFLLRHAEKAPLLADRAKALEEFPQLIGDIELAIGRSGDVLDSASPALAAVRSRLRQVAARTTERLNQILNSATYRPMIQDPVIVLRDDRRCIPVRAEYRREFKGIVHDQSSSGATLFMEPIVVVELNNELRQLEGKERQEVERVLARLTAAVARQGTRIHGTVEVLAAMDLASAKAKLADDMQATEPVLNRRGLIHLRDARHPLLNPETVVPLNLRLGDRFKALLITGPNTGGKTVGLKTVGLLTLMAQAGLQIPAAPGSELALFDQVFADIGDEQSIAQSLSTFSAHITNIVRILKTVGRHALVLMDEIGAGTDPAEGAALAKAVLSYLLSHNARVIATTHYGELKEFAYSREGIENAAVEFNPETLRPTYRLLQGVPGSSNAFHIARRLGMPNPVVDEARDSIGQAGIESGEVMRRLEKAKRVADEERRRAERLSKELEDLKSKYEARLHDLELLRREAKQRAAAEAQQLVRRYQEKTENIIGELRRIGKEGRKTNTARRKVKEASEDLMGGIGYENEPLPVEEADVPKLLKKGDKVRVLSLGGAVGEVLADSTDGEAPVQVGVMRVIVPLSNLRMGKNPVLPAPNVGAANAGAKVPLDFSFPAFNSGSGSTATLALTKALTIAPEITLIGMRVDAALPRLDKYLDDAFAVGMESVRVVHGKGTGQLRKAIWEYLRDDSRAGEVTQAHPDEGGAGATIIRLRQ
ncbi:MAG: endonuclease MutS2 [Cytophagales bacterium]|nr:endonuclease MutS2 [Armatimonadota bacterium]